MALFSNFIVIECKKGWNGLLLLRKDESFVRKEHANLITTCQTDFYYVKIGFRILTMNFTKNSLNHRVYGGY